MIMQKIWLFWVLLFQHNPEGMQNHKEPPCKCICSINVNAKYQRPDKNPPPSYKFALLRTCPQNNEEQQMAVRSVTLIWSENGQEQTHYRGIYEVLQVFETQAEAEDYARKNKIYITISAENRKLVLLE